jgi:hypothetical protein
MSPFAAAQDAPPAGDAKTFDVASVHANHSGALQTNISFTQGGVTLSNLPLRAIIQFAYGINQPSRLAGVPDWANVDLGAVSLITGRLVGNGRQLEFGAFLASRAGVSGPGVLRCSSRGRKPRLDSTSENAGYPALIQRPVASDREIESAVSWALRSQRAPATGRVTCYVERSWLRCAR